MYASASSAPLCKAAFTAFSAKLNISFFSSTATNSHLINSNVRSTIAYECGLPLPAPSWPQLKIFSDGVNFEERFKRVAAYRGVADWFADFAVYYFVGFLDADLEGAVDVGLSASETLKVITNADVFDQLFKCVVSRCHERVAHTNYWFDPKVF